MQPCQCQQYHTFRPIGQIVFALHCKNWINNLCLLSSSSHNSSSDSSSMHQVFICSIGYCINLFISNVSKIHVHSEPAINNDLSSFFVRYLKRYLSIFWGLKIPWLWFIFLCFNRGIFLFFSNCLLLLFFYSILFFLNNGVLLFLRNRRFIWYFWLIIDWVCRRNNRDRLLVANRWLNNLRVRNFLLHITFNFCGINWRISGLLLRGLYLIWLHWGIDRLFYLRLLNNFLLCFMRLLLATHFYIYYLLPSIWK